MSASIHYLSIVRAALPLDVQRFNITVFFFCLLVLLALPFASANAVRTEEIDLKEALRLFYKNNYEILINKYDVDKSYADYVGSKLLPNPTLQVNSIGSNFYTMPPSINANTQTTVRIDQLIELGGRRQMRINSAQESLSGAELFQKDKIRSLLTGFYDVWFDLLLDRLYIDFIKSDLAAFDNILKVADARFNAGTLSKIEHVKLHLFRLDRTTALTQAENKFLNRQEDFSLLLSSEKRFHPVAAAEVSGKGEILSEEDLIQKAMQNRYGILALQKQLNSAKLNLDIARSYKIPDITVGLEYDNWAFTPDPYFGGGVSMSIPLFNRNQGVIGKRIAERAQIETMIEKTRRNVIAEVRKALNNFMAAVTVETSFTKKKGEMEDLLKRSAASFALGGISTLELIDAQRTNMEFTTRYLQARMQTALNRQLLKVATGEID